MMNGYFIDGFVYWVEDGFLKKWDVRPLMIELDRDDSEQ